MSGSGTSGSTAWNNSVRSRLYLERIADEGHEPDPDRRRLRTMKSNYGRVGGEIPLRWQQGVFLAEEAGQAPMLDRMAAGAKAERVFLKLLEEFAEQGRRVNHQAAPPTRPSSLLPAPRLRASPNGPSWQLWKPF